MRPHTGFSVLTAPHCDNQALLNNPGTPYAHILGCSCKAIPLLKSCFTKIL